MKTIEQFSSDQYMKTKVNKFLQSLDIEEETGEVFVRLVENRIKSIIIKEKMNEVLVKNGNMESDYPST